MFYVDGGALSRLFPSVSHHAEFSEWFSPRVGSAMTSRLGISEFLQAADMVPQDERSRARALVERVRSSVRQIPFSEKNLGASAFAASVLDPFSAMHVGVAAADPEVDTFVTYTPSLARVAILYDLTVVAPGMPDGWHNGDADSSVKES